MELCFCGKFDCCVWIKFFECLELKAVCKLLCSIHEPFRFKCQLFEAPCKYIVVLNQEKTNRRTNSTKTLFYYKSCTIANYFPNSTLFQFVLLL